MRGDGGMGRDGTGRGMVGLIGVKIMTKMVKVMVKMVKIMVKITVKMVPETTQIHYYPHPNAISIVYYRHPITEGVVLSTGCHQINILGQCHPPNAILDQHRPTNATLVILIAILGLYHLVNIVSE